MDDDKTFPLAELLAVVVRGAHLGLLQRPVDGEWEKAFVSELQRRAETAPVDEVVGGFIRLIFESPESQSRALRMVGDRVMEPLVAPAQALRPAPLACISVGCLAATAGMLKRAGLRRWAGPFDWMTIPPAAVRDCLTDDMTALLTARHYEPIPPAERPAGGPGFLARHATYSAQYGETLFHQFDPLTEQGYAALERAALRLRESLRGLHGKMLLQVADETPDLPAIWEETGAVLDRFARGASLVTVSLVPGRPAGPFPEMDLAMTRGLHRLLRVRTLSETRATGFKDLMDEAVILRGAIASAAQELQPPEA